MKIIFLVFVLLISACACKGIRYSSDLGFLNSAQANSPEYLVKINGSFCKDMDGSIGLCAKRIKSESEISFKLDPRPYSYRLNVSCTSSVNFNLSVDVEKNQSFSFKIPPEAFNGLLSFTCIGEVFPNDREESVSAFWHSRFVVFDKNYQAREQIYTRGEYLILGQNAKYSLINEEIQVKNKAVYKIEEPTKAYSESQLMRFNYWGY